MGELLLLFLIEVVTVCAVYFALRWRVTNLSIPAIAFIACLAGLSSGWYSGYRISNSKMLEYAYILSSNTHQNITGEKLTNSQWYDIHDLIKKDTDFIKMARVEANRISIMPFIIVLLIILPIAHKHDRSRTQDTPNDK